MTKKIEWDREGFAVLHSGLKWGCLASVLLTLAIILYYAFIKHAESIDIILLVLLWAGEILVCLWLWYEGQD